MQHLLEKDSELVYDLLVKEKGHFYICGEAVMASEVRATLKAILKKFDGTNSTADNYLQIMKVRICNLSYFNEEYYFY